MNTPQFSLYHALLAVALAFGILPRFPAEAEIVINEFVAITTPDDDDRDDGGFRDEDGHLSDWLELHNTGDAQVSLGGYFLTDDRDNPRKYEIPSTFKIDAGGYVVVWCSMKDKRGLFASVPHANFKLERQGEYLALTNPDGEIIDEFDPYPPQYPNISYSRDGYMTNPSPGAENGPTVAAPTHEVDFSIKSRTFTGELVVELSSDGLPAGARIGYTLNGNLPWMSLFSPPRWYDATGPITISETTEVRARVFEDGKLPGEVRSEHYFKVSDELADWSSNLPVIVVESYNQRYTKSRFSPSSIMFLTPQGAEDGEDGEEKRTSIVQEAELESRMTARQRGSSTGGWPKKSLAMEMWFDDANWADREISPFGMPADGDWVLSGRYDFDRALMRNPLAYRFAREMGAWAPRTQFVEVFMNEDGDELEPGDYVGVFTFMEKIELHPDRINVQDPTGRNDGGFMVKVDRTSGQTGGGDKTFSAAGQTFVWIEPEKEFVTTAQNNWLRDHFNHIEDVMESDELAEDPEQGYRSLIDVDSWIDEYILRTLTRDPDGFRLSTYLYMPRNGKVHYGPVWDFDRTMGCDSDTRARTPEAWVDYFATYGWWADLFGSGVNRKPVTAQRPEFLQDYIDRYQKFRRTVLDVDHMNSIIDEFADQLREGQERNFEKWRGQRPDAGNVKDYNDGVAGWEGELVHLKGWLKARVEWMDDHYVSPPGFEPSGGLVEAGATVRVQTGGNIFNPQNAYVTTDGTDPRQRGGDPSENAAIAPANLTIDGSVTYVARAEQGGRWSGPITTAFVVDGIPASRENLLVSEIMYHPADGSVEEQGSGFFHEDSFEFIELLNVGEKTMYIGDVTLAGGIDFPLSESAVQALEPGGRVVFASDLEAFALRYGKEGIPLGGEFVGRLSNGGERIALLRGEEVIQDFSYNDRAPWPEIPDAYGHSLALSDPKPGIDLSNPLQWTADTSIGGSPGSAGSVIPPVYVNEVLANSGVEAPDWVELHNPGDAPVDLSGWFLTDDSGEPGKYALPDGTVIEAGAYLVFEQESGGGDPAFGDAFGLGSNGDGIYLFSANAEGGLTGFQDGFRFGASDEGQTFGRLETSTGEVEYPLQIGATPGAANSGPAVGPVVISEFMYHPDEDTHPNGEFIEIYNSGSEPVVLAAAGEPDTAWRLSGADFAFPEGTTIAPGQIVLVVAMPPNEFTAAPSGTTILGPLGGRLSNGGETLRLQRPGTPYQEEEDGPLLIPYITVDEVDYNDKDPWPLEPDGTGPSLERVNLGAFGSDAANWTASLTAGGTPGVLPGTGSDLLDWQGEHFTEAEIADEAVSGLAADPDADGLLNVYEYAFNTDPKAANGAVGGEVGTTRVDGVDYATVSYTRRAHAEVVMRLQASTNLAEWSAVEGAVLEVRDLGNGLETATFRDTEPVGAGGQRYLRVRITGK